VAWSQSVEWGPSSEQSGGTRALITNGKSDGVTHPHGRSVTLDDHTTILLGALGPIHHPKGQTAAVIGLGTGTSSAVLLESQAIRQLDTIEIEPMVVEAAQLFRPRNAKVFDDPRSRIVIDDARAHFSKTRARYDIVVSEPSNPWVSGVAGLFTFSCVPPHATSVTSRNDKLFMREVYNESARYRHEARVIWSLPLCGICPGSRSRSAWSSVQSAVRAASSSRPTSAATSPSAR